jgi:enoyl-[acyl-carrier protein] reductase I
MLSDHGAELAFTYQGERWASGLRRLRPRSGRTWFCRATWKTSPRSTPLSLPSTSGGAPRFRGPRNRLFRTRNELKGRYADTSRENFSRTMLISCFSFTEIAKRAATRMKTAER